METPQVSNKQSYSSTIDYLAGEEQSEYLPPNTLNLISAQEQLKENLADTENTISVLHSLLVDNEQKARELREVLNIKVPAPW